MGRRSFEASMGTTGPNIIGERIYEHRVALELTQDQFGAKYGVSGPAIFKFEKGYVKPSLDLWLVLSKDFKIPEKKAVLMWVKSRLPEKYQSLIDIKSASIAEEPIPHGNEPGSTDYSKIKDRGELRQSTLKDSKLPKGLKDLIKETDTWNLYKPTGAEINFLRDTFGKLGKGSHASFREALRLVREFTGAE